jgi:hypothetical protein
MRAELAERLLARVMGWEESEVAQYRPYLQDMAGYKYDSYQQFAPGMRFVESLAIWLQQFGERELREAAFDFVLNRLVFFSSAEMDHFVAIAYQDCVVPILAKRAASQSGISPHLRARVCASSAFSQVRRRSLFLGLSDGARTDVFRRQAAGELSNEQIWQSYEVGKTKADELKKMATSGGHDDGPAFDTVFLLDDFTASGRTYLRLDPTTGEHKGKIVKFLSGISELSILAPDAELHLVVYVATSAACEYLSAQAAEYLAGAGHGDLSFHIHTIQCLQPALALNHDQATLDPRVVDLIARYYDSDAENDHTRVGGVDVKYGFAGCGLPVVLAHNTPNNSVFLLWTSRPPYALHGLFPRVSRHQ